MGPFLKLRCLSKLLCFTVAAGLSSVCAADDSSTDLQRFQYTKTLMGMQCRIVLFAPSEDAALGASQAAFARMDHLEAVLSDYREDSELAGLLRQDPGKPVKVSRDLFMVLRRSQDFAARTAGAFDVSVGPLTRLWRQARRGGSLPSPAALHDALARVGWQNLELDPVRSTITLGKNGMQLDFGGIAKGYACDEALGVLRQQGIASAMVELGGDIAVSGAPPGRVGWNISLPDIQNPDARYQTLTHASISTSGDTEQFVEIEGRRYSHIVDPKTGLGLTHRTSVTVIARHGIVSDALSTSLSVMGEKAGRELLAGEEYQGIRAYFRTARE